MSASSSHSPAQNLAPASTHLSVEEQLRQLREMFTLQSESQSLSADYQKFTAEMKQFQAEMELFKAQTRTELNALKMQAGVDREVLLHRFVVPKPAEEEPAKASEEDSSASSLV